MTKEDKIRTIMSETIILYERTQKHKQPIADRIISRWRVSLYGPYLVEMGQTCGGPFQADKIRDHIKT